MNLEEELLKLNELKEQGIISDEEYNIKRKDILFNNSTYSNATSSNTTTEIGNKKFEAFASVSYWLGISSIILSIIALALLIIGISIGKVTHPDSMIASVIIFFISLIFSSVVLADSIPGLIFGRISSNKAIVNKSRSVIGFRLSLISLIVSILLLIASTVFYTLVLIMMEAYYY